MTYSNFVKKSKSESLKILSGRIINNLSLTSDIIRYCKKKEYAGYRMTSELFPLVNHPEINLEISDLPRAEEIFNLLDAIGLAIKETQLKITFHPSEFISLTSSDAKVINNSICDLEFHALIFDLIGLRRDYSAPINIHCRKDGNPEELSEIFFNNLNKCSESLRNRLVVENNDNPNGVWSIKNLYDYFYKRYDIPITFDTLHHSLLSHGLGDDQAFKLAYSTWPKGITPVFHYSEGIDNTRKHADFAQNSPPDYDKNVIWEVELKGKDYAIDKIKGIL
jgi:UV DNA damage endonuclease